MPKESPASESIMSPLRVCVMAFSSESASGMNFPSDDFSPFMVFMAGWSAIIASPRSWTVVSLSWLCSSAILMLLSIFVTLRISASSLPSTLLVLMSCCCMAATTR